MSNNVQNFQKAMLREGFVIRSKRNSKTEDRLILAAVIEMANLGYIVDQDQISGMSTSALMDMIENARSIIGDDRDMTPIYPGFPKQVQELSTLTLLVEQIIHYWSHGTIIPDYPDVEREGIHLDDALRNAREVQVVTAGEASKKTLEDLLNKKIAFSEQDKNLLSGALEFYEKMNLETAVEKFSKMKHEENAQTFMKIFMEKYSDSVSLNDAVKAFSEVSRTSNQLLRTVLGLATVPQDGMKASSEKKDLYTSSSRDYEDFERAVFHLSNGHAFAFSMKNLNRSARKTLVYRLGALTKGHYADILLSKQNLWAKVMRMVHPYDQKLTAESRRALDIIHKNIEHKTVNSLIEESFSKGDLLEAIRILEENQFGNLLRRISDIARRAEKAGNSDEVVKTLSEAIVKNAKKTSVSTLVSSYNGVLSINDENERLIRKAGGDNFIAEKTDRVKIKNKHQRIILEALEEALVIKLGGSEAPKSPVAVKNENPLPLVNRDYSESDRKVERGSRLASPGEGDTVRIFGHWNNNMNTDGYMDIGVAIFDDKMNKLAVIDWSTWAAHRSFSTYSGDCLVHLGGSAAEYFDIDLEKMKKTYPEARWMAMTIQSYSGFPINKVDFIAGVMFRSKPDSGEVFEPRSVETAFKPSTSSLQSIPLVFDMETRETIWIDSSSGSNRSGLSSNYDETISSVVYDEILREKMTIGQFAGLWAKAHNVETTDDESSFEEVKHLL